MRAFLGIDLDGESRGDLARLCQAVRDAAPSWRGEKWVEPVNLHLTLKFLGQVETDVLDALVPALRDHVAAYDPFSLPFASAPDPVPGPRRARMLWARYADPEGRCAELASGIDNLAATLGFEGEERDFVPHVTLARARRPRPYDVSLPIPSLGYPCLSVGEVMLFSSTLTKSGPVYDRIEAFPLEVR